MDFLCPICYLFHCTLLHTHPLSLDLEDMIDQSDKKRWITSKPRARLHRVLYGICMNDDLTWHVYGAYMWCRCAAIIATAKDLSSLCFLILWSLMWGSVLCPNSRGCLEKSPGAFSHSTGYSSWVCKTICCESVWSVSPNPQHDMWELGLLTVRFVLLIPLKM